MANYGDSSTYSTASGKDGLQYVVLQVTLKEKFLGTGSGNLSALEEVLNEQAAKGYRLHTITTASAQSGGFLGGDRIQARWYLKKSEFAERKRYEENSSALIDTVIGAEYSCAGTRRGKNGTEEVYNACQRA